MLNRYTIAERMSEHFSRWMDIRKRLDNSNGGKLIHSVAKGIEDINIAIEEYRKEFFISHYLDKTHEIIDHLYYINVGEIDIDRFSYLDYKLSKNKKEFYTNNKNYFYENGKIYFKPNDIEVQKKITYIYKGYEMKADLFYSNVWNIYDEFAIFLGLERYDKESNEQLLKRILNLSKVNPNSNEKGIKGAVINALIPFGDIYEDEIIISNPNDTLMNKYKEYFKDIIEEITFIDKDVLRAKRWDIDVWNYGFGNINYIPHMWDVFIENYLDGVGYNNSLKVKLENSPNYSNVNISTYKKSEKMVNEYIKNKNLSHNINMKLVKYEDQLEMKRVDYQITAETVKNLSDQNVIIESFDYENGVFTERASDIIRATHTDEVKEFVNLDLDNGKEYKIVFRPEGNNYPMTIKDAYKTINGKKVSLMNKIKMKYPFEMTEDGIVNTKCDYYMNTKSDFLEFENLDQQSKGDTIEMVDINKPSFLSFKVGDVGGKIISVNYEIDTSNLPEDLLTLTDFTSIGSNLYSANKKGGSISSKIRCNYLELEVKGECEIVTDKGIRIPNKSNSYRKIIVKEQSDTPEKIAFVIKDYDGKTEVRNIMYKDFEIQKETEKGKIKQINNIDILPDEDSNTIDIKLETHTSSAIHIKGIYIGYNTINDRIELIDRWSDKTEDLTIITDTIMDVYSDSKLIEKDFTPGVIYYAEEDNQLLEIDVDNYHDFKFLGDVNIHKNEDKYFVLLKKGEFLDSLTIEGKRLKNISYDRLNDLFGVKVSNGDKIYIADSIDPLIIIKDGIEEKIELTRDLFSKGKDVYKINNLPDDVHPVFVTKNRNIESNTHEKDFVKIKFSYKDSIRHVANNTYNMYNNKEIGVTVINNFVPSIDHNKIMYYEIQVLNSEDYKVVFDNEKETNFSMGLKAVNIYSKNAINNPKDYQKEMSFVNERFILSQEILLDRYVQGYDLTKFIIELPKGHTIKYSTKSTNDTFINAGQYYRNEIISSNENLITKLNSSNIDEIIYMGKTKWNGENNQKWEIDIDYKLFKDEGIIVWDKEIVDNFFIVYTVKIPEKIVIDDSILYKKVSIPIEYHDKVGEINKSIEVEDTYEIEVSSLGNDFDKIVVNIDNPNLDHYIDDGIITIYTKNNVKNSVAINPGYYYINGKEHYLYHTPKYINIENVNPFIKENIIQKDGYWIFSKEAYNMLNNSKFKLLDDDTIYYEDFENTDYTILGSSNKGITSCDDINKWRNTNNRMYLTEAYNGLGFKIEPIDNKLPNYSYIDITDIVDENKNNVSLYATSGVTAYLAVGLDKDIDVEDLSVNTYLMHRDNEFLNYDISKIDKNKRFYLIVSGEGIIDDIIVSETKNMNIHKKNITSLNIPNLKEISQKTYVIDDPFLGGQTYDIEIDKGKLRTTTNIQWGEKSIFNYNSSEDWERMSMYGVDIINNNIVTKTVTGNVKTPNIRIDNDRNVKEIIVKYNDMYLSGFDNIKVDVMTTNLNNDSPINIGTGYTNYTHIVDPDTRKYIYLDFDIPPNRILKSIEVYVVYKETYKDKPIIEEIGSGIFYSKVYDMEKESDYRMNIEVKSNVTASNHIVRVRAAKPNSKGNYVWSKWYDLKDNHVFKNYRLFQYKVEIYDEKALVDIDKVSIENINKKE